MRKPISVPNVSLAGTKLLYDERAEKASTSLSGADHIYWKVTSFIGELNYRRYPYEGILHSRQSFPKSYLN